jgi:phage head maturation protease
LEASASRLVYCEDDGGDLMQKSIRDGSDILPGAILEYDAVLSTREKDRDGDIVEPKGMAVDANMPLLWQHLQLQPIGKHIQVLSQDESTIKCKFAIADIPLGRDAATLVRMGALRKSHGFVPSDAAPIEKYKGADGKEYVKGWHIKTSSVMEGSLVSIPANPGANITTVYAKEFDGIVTAFSRDMLEDPLVKRWAKGFFDMRPKSARGIGDGRGRAVVKKGGVSVSVGSGAAVSVDGVRIEVEKGGTYTEKPSGDSPTTPQPAPKRKKCPQCGSDDVDHTGTCASCGYVAGSTATDSHPGTPKAAEPVEVKAAEGYPSPAGQAEQAVETKMYGMSDNYLEGSYEWTRDKLDDSLYKYLSAQGVDTPDRWSVDIVATFASDAIVCVRDYSKTPTERRCYRLGWQSGDSGPKWTGEPQEVEIKAVVLEKAFDVLVRSRKAAEKQLTLAEQASELCAKAIFSTDEDPHEILRTLKSAVSVIQDQLELQEFEEFRSLIEE